MILLPTVQAINFSSDLVKEWWYQSSCCNTATTVAWPFTLCPSVVECSVLQSSFVEQGACSQTTFDSTDLITSYGCPSPQTAAVEQRLLVNSFQWNIMRQVYLYRSDVPLLLQSEEALFTNETVQYLFASTYPQILYHTYLTTNADPYSFFIENYEDWVRIEAGLTETHGMEFSIYPLCKANPNMYVGFVRYTRHGSDAWKKGVRRGDYF